MPEFTRFLIQAIQPAIITHPEVSKVIHEDGGDGIAHQTACIVWV